VGLVVEIEAVGNEFFEIDFGWTFGTAIAAGTASVAAAISTPVSTSVAAAITGTAIGTALAAGSSAALANGAGWTSSAAGATLPALTRRPVFAGALRRRC
jgi:hypothetical protein